MRPYRNVILWIASTALFLTLSAAHASPIRVLFIAGNQPGQSHDFIKNPEYLTQALSVPPHAGGFTVTLRTANARNPVSDFLDEALKQLDREHYDVLVMYTYKYSDRNGWAQKIVDFVNAGGGLVALHGTSGTFTNSKPFIKMLGARFVKHGRGAFNVEITDPKDPIMADVSNPLVLTRDEDYFHQFDPETPRAVLARIILRPGQRPQPSTHNAGATAASESANACAWKTMTGKGRVFYTSLGHGKETWSNPEWLKMVTNAITWASGSGPF